MWTIIVLLLCGILCVSALPRCSDEEFEACNPTGEKKENPIETAEQLEDMCRYRNTVLKCQVDFMDRCTNYPTSGMGDYIKQFYRTFGALCDMTNPLRIKFLNNARCMNPVSIEVYDICKYGKDDSTLPHDVFCNNVKRALKCFEQTMAERCGEDAREVFVFALNPEYQLRSTNCE